MRGVVVYESMFGSTRAVAEALAEGLAPTVEVEVAKAADTDPARAEGLDLLVVGAPTHAHGMPRPSTRRGGPEYVERSHGELTLEEGADHDPGVREWIAGLPQLHGAAVAFDTRIDMSPIVTGRASHGIAKALAKHGVSRAAPPESFLVDKQNHLLAGETERARAWGAHLAELVAKDQQGVAR